jgi:hypothetical protein
MHTKYTTWNALSNAFLEGVGAEMLVEILAACGSGKVEKIKLHMAEE